MSTTENGSSVSTPDPHGEPEAPPLRSLADAVAELGFAWARYGLTMGRQALQVSAKSLETTAKALGTLADSFEKRHPGEASGSDETRSH